MSNQENYQSLDVQSSPFMAIEEVAAIFGVTKASIYRDRHQGGTRYPAPLKDFKSPLKWRKSDVLRHIDQLEVAA